MLRNCRFLQLDKLFKRQTMASCMWRHVCGIMYCMSDMRLILCSNKQVFLCFDTERVTEDNSCLHHGREPSHKPYTILWVSIWMSWDWVGLNYRLTHTQTHTRAHQKSTQCIMLSQTRHLHLRRDIINVNYPNSQLHSSTLFSLLVDFL